MTQPAWRFLHWMSQLPTTLTMGRELHSCGRSEFKQAGQVQAHKHVYNHRRLLLSVSHAWKRTRRPLLAALALN